jgi:hypothetical protein
MYVWDLEKRRGLSAYDVRNNFSANFTYELPFGQGLSGLTRALVAGWQVNGILTLMDGSPLTVFDSSAAQLDRIGAIEGLTVDLIPGGNPNPVRGGSDQYYDVTQFAPSKVGYFGTLPRNTVIGPGLATVDGSVFKAFSTKRLGEVTFRLEMFNLLNRTNLGTPNMTAFVDGVQSPTAGQIASTRTPARQMQWVCDLPSEISEMKDSCSPKSTTARGARQPVAQ